jgi:hypothetical protein
MPRTLTSTLKYLALVFILSCQNQDDGHSEKTIQKKDSSVVNNQAVNPYAPTDVSPMDMSYYPVDYPKLKMSNSISEPPVARVIYSRPHLQGRQMFGQILKYGDPWRLGANEATEIQFYRDVTIQGKKINAGRYVLYCIPHENTWTIILNSGIDTWGLKIDASKDLYRFDVPVIIKKPPVEFFTMVFEKTDLGADLVMVWDMFVARLPIQFPS